MSEGLMSLVAYSKQDMWLTSQKCHQLCAPYNCTLLARKKYLYRAYYTDRVYKCGPLHQVPKDIIKMIWDILEQSERSGPQITFLKKNKL